MLINLYLTDTVTINNQLLTTLIFNLNLNFQFPYIYVQIISKIHLLILFIICK